MSRARALFGVNRDRPMDDLSNDARKDSSEEIRGDAQCAETTRLRSQATHAFPRDLATFVTKHWEDAIVFRDPYCWLTAGSPEPLPDPILLESLLSTCYQASLLREEDRPVRFRLMLRQPESFGDDEGPPVGLHRLVFTKPRPFNEHEIRRLSPATTFCRSLIGVGFDSTREAVNIWGQIHSGPGWIQSIDGGRRMFHPLPPALVVSVLGPGRITVSKGSVTVGKLWSGRITSPSTEIADAEWVKDAFAATNAELLRLHGEDQRKDSRPWATVDPDFARLIVHRAFRQIISRVRDGRHGGTLVLVPPELAAELCSPNPFLSIKYAFTDERSRRRLQDTVVRVMNSLSQVHGARDDPVRTVGWLEYVTSTASAIALAEEALIEAAHFVADLTAVDGAVVITKTFEILGFGGEISGGLEAVTTIARALDADATGTQIEPTETYGTRHRSAYRLCAALPEAVAIVISQDGDVRSIKYKGGQVTCWAQVAESILDV
jgi:hypothetical protein